VDTALLTGQGLPVEEVAGSCFCCNFPGLIRVAEKLRHELRADVFPVDDIGLQKAIARHYNGDERLDAVAMRALGANWQPYRSVATWYLWRSLDPIPVEY
jgi:hypothetical protein